MDKPKRHILDIPRDEPRNSAKYDLAKVQENLVDWANKVSDFPIIGAQLIEKVVVPAGGDITVNHGMGRIPKVLFISRGIESAVVGLLLVSAADDKTLTLHDGFGYGSTLDILVF